MNNTKPAAFRFRQGKLLESSRAIPNKGKARSFSNEGRKITVRLTLVKRGFKLFLKKKKVLLASLPCGGFRMCLISSQGGKRAFGENNSHFFFAD